MPSYILFVPARHELRLRCALCEKVVVLSNSARLTPSGEILPDPAAAIRQHYADRTLVRGACEHWFGESQDFFVKHLPPTRRTLKFSWPDPEEEEDYECYIRCTLCGAEEGYSGPTEVGLKGKCETCEHPLFQHEIIVSALFGEPDTLSIEIPRFT
jgi:hypothetical protein